MRSTRAIIDLQAVQHNLKVAKQLAPQSKVMAVVKADAYGHGIVQIAKALHQADAIAVACIDEAITLREAGVDSEIIILEGFFSEHELTQVFSLGLQTVIHQQIQLETLECWSKNAKAANQENQSVIVWLKLDSGMNRLGFEPKDYLNAFQRVKGLNCVKEVRLLSHLACADDIEDAKTQRQISTFTPFLEALESEASLANSAGVIAWPESHFQWVRPGILLYGCSPMQGLNGAQHHLKPVMTLESQLFAIRQLAAGDTVGYGATWTATQACRIGVIAIGYGDGYPHHAQPGTPVLINGKCYPLVGRVSMDMITVDLGDDDLPLGLTATLWGEGLPVEVVAKHAGTIPWSLLCGVTSRVKFEYQQKTEPYD